ncbi:DNA-binding response regulator [Pseudonocardiaceae bacterium YIM PH 21723]|nr:DNA-binding response regulator [Pseudonocardiaceae bacterium YIM PH 21723]
MAHVLLIEDDPAVREGMRLALGRNQHQVSAADSGEVGLQLLATGDLPDIVVLDLMLPGINGFEVCRRVRSTYDDLPIIMLTARSDDFDIVAGLEAGADDYVVKPVEPRVLEARISAVLRRGGGTQPAKPAANDSQYGGLEIDRMALTVRRGGTPVSLTPTELKLLLELSSSPGQVLSREQLLRAVWEHDYLGDSRLVDACVQRLRAKIETDPAKPVYVQTVRGFGYRFGPV